MKREIVPRALLWMVLVTGWAGCGGEKVDGRLNLQLVWVCEPSMADLQSEISVYCISVFRPGGGEPDQNCSSSIETLQLKLDETSEPVEVMVEALNDEGRPVARGVSPPVRLVSGELNTVAIPAVPLDMFSLVAGEGAGCQRLPFFAADHTANVFPSSHVLVTGSASPDLVSTEAALLVDPVTWKSHVISTPFSAHRSGHSASLLHDGRVIVAGGINQHGSTLDEVVVLRGGEIFLEPYDRVRDYTSVRYETMENDLMVPRSLHHASVFHGDQVLLNDGERTAEMILGSSEQSAFIEVGGVPQYDPFPIDNGRVATVVPLDGERALLLGTTSNHNGMLLVSKSSRVVTFEPYNLSTVPRSRPIGIAFSHDSAMFLGGFEGASPPESPVVVIDSAARAVHEVVVDPNTFPQRGYTATLLADGRVFVVGGISARPGYQPGSTFLLERQGEGPENWSVYPGRPLRLPRAYHTASLLPDGRLLIIGGIAASAEVTNQQTATSAEVIAF